jgi:hypothetical protein
MRSRWIGWGVVLALAGGMAGCAPGPTGYAGWSGYRQQQASDEAALARRNGEAAQWQAQSGDYWGAQQSQAAANAEAGQAQRDAAHASRDRWLSGF